MILKKDDTIRFIDKGMKSLDKIPAGNWLVKYQQKELYFYLEKQEDFTLPDKVYGDIHKEANRYLKSFRKKPGNLGVLLKGLKGTGKSLTAKAVCINSKLPVILITEPFAGSDFEDFLSNIEQECIVFIDEFEKTYKDNQREDESPQDTLLTILDGVFQSKKLFILTANDGEINTALLNRPGRIHYVKKYKGLARETIDAIIEDKLVDKKHKEEILEIVVTLGEINMDGLTTLIWEVNEYGENPKTAINHLNIEPAQLSYQISWEITESGIGTNSNNVLKYTTVIYKSPLLYPTGFHVEGRLANNTGRSVYSSKDINMALSTIKIEEKKITITCDDIVYTCIPTDTYELVF